MEQVNYSRQYLDLTDKAILDQCDVHLHKASGPGGQHRNKVTSAVRLKHRPTGVTASAPESRSQHENKRLALRRLRMNIACRIRCQVEIPRLELPPAVAEHTFQPRGRAPHAPRRLEVGRKDKHFWHVAAFLLDLLEAFEGRLAEAAACIGITTSNFAAVLKSDRHLLAAAQRLRKRFNQKPID